MARLTSKVVPITGATGGQGAAEAELFLREEGAVVLTDIDTAAGEALAQRLSRQRSSPNSCAMTLEPSTGFGSTPVLGRKSALPRRALLWRKEIRRRRVSDFCSVSSAFWAAWKGRAVTIPDRPLHWARGSNEYRRASHPR
jgi:hypothetical protein